MTLNQRYEQVRRDFENLEELAELTDQVTVMDEVQNFMREPTKEFAIKLYDSSIRLWFREHGITSLTSFLAKRYGITGRKS